MSEATSSAAKKTRKSPQRREAVPLPRDTPQYKGTVLDDDLKRPGGRLLAMLNGRAQELGHSKEEMANHLGMTYGYIAQIASGVRKPEHLSSEMLDNCGKYLGVSKLMVLMAAGIVKPEDTLERPDELDTAVGAAMQFIARDARFGPILPSELLDPSCSLAVQYFVVRLYEEATDRKLLAPKTVPEIAQSIQLVERRRQELMKGV